MPRMLVWIFAMQNTNDGAQCCRCRVNSTLVKKGWFYNSPFLCLGNATSASLALQWFSWAKILPNHFHFFTVRPLRQMSNTINPGSKNELLLFFRWGLEWWALIKCKPHFQMEILRRYNVWLMALLSQCKHYQDTLKEMSGGKKIFPFSVSKHREAERGRDEKMGVTDLTAPWLSLSDHFSPELNYSALWDI